MLIGAVPVRYAKTSWSGLAGGRVEFGGEDVGGAMVSGSGACCGAARWARIDTHAGSGGSDGNANGGGTLCGSTAFEMSHTMPSAWCGSRKYRDRSMSTGFLGRPHVMTTSSPVGPAFTAQLSVGRFRMTS